MLTYKRLNVIVILCILSAHVKLGWCNTNAAAAPKKYVGAIDQGTSSTRFMVFNEQGEVVSIEQMEHDQIYPKPGWVEHNPNQIWENTEKCIKKALKKGKLKPTDLAAIGITNQRETTVVWNKHTGEPYYNAIVWNDIRTAEICSELEKGSSKGIDRFRGKTGLPIAPYFSATKLKWIFDHFPEAKAAAETGDALFGTMDCFLAWKLSGGTRHLTDVTNACRTLLLDLDTLDWDEGQLAALGVPRACLPEIVPSSKVLFECAAGTGLEGVPLAGILGDQQAALFGQACFAPGEAKATYGTGAFVLMNTGAKVASRSGLLTTVAYQLDGQAAVYALEGSVAYCGSLIQWLRDNLGLIGSAAETEALAASVPDTGGMYLVPAFSGLFAPRWRKDARGVAAGLTAFNTRAHFVRAALEAAAFQVYEVMGAMEKDSGVKVSALKVDGGMTANALVMQFQADLIRASVTRPRVPETTALGAAYAAGLAVGLFPGLEQITANWQLSKHWEPEASEDAITAKVRGWEKAVERTLGWTDEDTAA